MSYFYIFIETDKRKWQNESQDLLSLPSPSADKTEEIWRKREKINNGEKWEQERWRA
jgi:hypothetical protein